jgi:uncharacterized protein YceK
MATTKRLLIVLLVVISASGCASVRPWQRELLAQPGMRVDPTPESDAEQHMLSSREGSFGGYGASGGGCGCN